MKNEINSQSRFGLESVASLVHLLARHTWLWAALGLLAALAPGPQPVRAAAVTEAWVQRYTNNGGAHAHAVAVDGSGNVVVTGYSDRSLYNHDYYTAKYAAADGVLLWEKRYNGPENFDDRANAVAVDGRGKVVVTGSSDNGTNGYNDYYTAKYAAADGALLWEKRYNGPENFDDIAQAVAVDGSDNVVVTGYSYGSNYGDYYTAKYAAVDGALLWEKRYNGPGNGFDQARAVAVDSSGNVVVTGDSEGSGSYNDYYTAKYAAADGALLWEKRYNGPENSEDQARGLAVDSSGNVVVTGFSYRGSLVYSNTDNYTAKYAAADGTLLWEKRQNGLFLDEYQHGAGAVAVDSVGNVVVTGSFYNGTNADYHTAKYAAVDGALLWEKRYNGPANSFDQAQAVVVDGGGNVVVTGSSRNSITNTDYYTAKYAAADGALLWEKRYHDPANANYWSANSLALGPNGMVAVTGSIDGPFGPGAAWATVVYRETLPPLSVELVSTGIRFRFTGVPGRSYNVERSPAVTGPWSTINTQTASASGLLEYLDTNAPAGAAFYRTMEP